MTLTELRERQARRRALVRLALACGVTLAVVGLGACGPSDVDIARSGTPATEPQVVAMSAVPAERLVTTTAPTTTAPTTTVAPTTTATPVVTAAPTTTAAAKVTPRADDPFSALAACESTGDRDGVEPHRINPAAVNPSGKYRGAFQFDAATYASVGGTGDPAAQSYAEQLHRAQLLQARRGWSPWPDCSKRLGLR